MNMKTLLFSCVAAFAIACGSSGENNDQTANNQASGNNAATVSVSVDDVTLNGSGFALVVDGGAVNLPDVESETAAVAFAGGTLTVTGDGGAASIQLTAIVSGELEVKTYDAGLMSVSFVDPDYQCNQADMATITVTSTAPIAGEFATQMLCQSRSDFNDNFRGSMAGKFAAAE
jgi:hypothetical protein